MPAQIKSRQTMTDLYALLAIFAKAYGLFLFIGLSIAVVVYAYWPANRERFRKAARDVLDEGAEDKPWR